MIFYGITCVAAFLIIVAYIGFYSKKDIWFLMTFISLFICNTGYFFLAISRSLNEALLANRIAYLGSVFLPFFLLMTIIKVCKCNYPLWLPFVLSFVNAAVLLITISGGYSDIYYREVSFATVNGIGTLVKEYGWLHTSYYVYLIAYFAAMIGVISRSFFNKKIVSYKHAIRLAVSVFLNIAIYFTEKALDLEIEFLSLSYIVTAFFLLLIYKRLEDYDIDRIMQSTLETDSTGVVLFDESGHFKGCNDDAAAVFPELHDLKLEFPIPKANLTLQSTLIAAVNGTSGADHTTYRRNGRIYKIQAKPFCYKLHGKRFGVAVVISDDTAQQEYMNLLSSYNDKLEHEVAQKTLHVREMHNSLILGMADMVDGRDPNTGSHIKRTSSVVSVFVKKLRDSGYGNFQSPFLDNVAKAAPMHDLGKIAIDDAILRKPGKYTPDEYSIMRTHAEKGAEIVSKILKRDDDPQFYDIAVNVAHYHHEKYDGTGYPDGLSGEKIPVEARIMALADVFDALVSMRCYKKAYSYQEAFKIISDSLGSHFDPELGSFFLSCKDELIACYKDADGAAI